MSGDKRIKAFLFGLWGVLIFTNANADCRRVPDKQVQVKIDKISAPLFNGKGAPVKGCILHTNGRVLGYTQEEKLCHTRVGNNLALRLSYGCCDTGPNFGDVECIVRSKAALVFDVAHGNGVVVHSAAAS